MTALLLLDFDASRRSSIRLRDRHRQDTVRRLPERCRDAGRTQHVPRPARLLGPRPPLQPGRNPPRSG